LFWDVQTLAEAEPMVTEHTDIKEDEPVSATSEVSTLSHTCTQYACEMSL